MRDILGQEKSLARVLERQTGTGRAAMLEAAWSLREASKIVITAIGASLHSAYPLHYALAGGGMNCSIVEIAELLHYQERICAGAVVVIFSRSGESIEVVKLLDKLKGVASRVIAITNEPENALAKRADVTIFVDSLPDEIVAVQSYTGGVAAGLLLAGAVGEAFDARVGEISACLPRVAVLHAGRFRRSGSERLRELCENALYGVDDANPTFVTEPRGACR